MLTHRKDSGPTSRRDEAIRLAGMIARKAYSIASSLLDLVALLVSYGHIAMLIAAAIVSPTVVAVLLGLAALRLGYDHWHALAIAGAFLLIELGTGLRSAGVGLNDMAGPDPQSSSPKERIKRRLGERRRR
jgi:hypothetical protein